MRQLLNRLMDWLRRDRLSAERDEELRFHQQMLERDQQLLGATPDEAKSKARRRLGNVTRLREEIQAMWTFAWLEGVAQDARVAWRGLRRTPGFAIVVIATLALGIGANAAVYSVVSRALIDRLPYRAPDRLIHLYGASTRSPNARGMLSGDEIEALRSANRSLATLTVWGMQRGMTYVTGHETEMWSGVSVGPNFFRTLGAKPLLGRAIDERDVGGQATPTVLLTYSVWQRAFAGDSSVIGRRIKLNDEMPTIIGVMPRNFVSPTYTASADVWLPLDLPAFMRRPHGGMYAGWRVVGRLADGVTVAQARADLSRILKQVDEGHPTAEKPLANPVVLRDAMVGEGRPVLLVVMGAALLVLLVACVNIAGLFLTRATARRRELAVRAALGAGRWRVTRQLVVEAMLLSGFGGGVGIVLAVWGKRVLLQVGDRIIPPMGEVQIDAGVIGFAVALSLAIGLTVGLIPALASLRQDVNPVLGDSSRAVSGGRPGRRAGRVLVGGQMALAVMLLVGAGLLGRTLMALVNSGVGYSTESDVLSFVVGVTGPQATDATQRGQFFDALLERMRAIPGVTAAGTVAVSIWNGWARDSVTVEGTNEWSEPSRTLVTEGYFASLGIPLRAGRDFGPTDREGTPRVAVVSERYARERLPRGRAIGSRVRIGRDTTWREVVGVVGDVREAPAAEREATVYESARQTAMGGEVLMRASGNAMDLVPAIRRELRTLNAGVPLVMPRTMEDIFHSTIAGQRLMMLFTIAFAILAVTLAALGVYGVMAYTVAARAHEMGIRAALGARRNAIVGLVLREGLMVAVTGTVVGLALAAGGSRLLAGLLFGVTAHDMLTFVAAPVVLIAVTAFACVLPARRAAQADPVEALRAE